MIINEIRSELEWFAIKMEERLKKNDFKGGWKSCDIYYLRSRADANLTSLGFKDLTQRNTDKKLKKFIVKECADCANFCMMIADNLRDKEVD